VLALASQRGFTLAELTIVAVIVTLLVGGVLRGQEMVVQARIRDVTNDLNGVSAAYQIYFDRYKAIPGDDRNGAARWPAFNAKSGGGDGLVSGKYMDPAPLDPTAATFTVDNTQNESLAFWWGMRMAGFVGGPPTGPGAATQPSNAFGGMVGVQTGGLGFSTLIVCSSNVPAVIAGPVDALLDDMRPDTGGVRAYRQSASNEDVMGKAPNVAAYDESSGAQYVLCKRI